MWTTRHTSNLRRGEPLKGATGYSLAKTEAEGNRRTDEGKDKKTHLLYTVRWSVRSKGPTRPIVLKA